MITKIPFKAALLCSGALVASIAFSAVVSESFNKDSLDPKWSGDVSLKEESPSSLPAGAPIGTKDGETAKVLELGGEVRCSSPNGKQVDFLLNVSGPNDELPNGTEFDSVQIAVAVGSSESILDDQSTIVPLMLYGKKASESSAEWFEISSLKVGSWVRVTLNFDYSNGRCKVSIDGIPVVSDNGTLKADGSGGKGSWYLLANSSDKIDSLTFLGTSKIDDLVVNENVSEVRFPEDAKKRIQIADGVTEEVSLNDLNRWGVTPDIVSSAKVDDSGLTVLQKLECGLKPDDGKKFQLTSMEMSKVIVDGNEKTVAKINFPGSDSALSRYRVTATDSSGNAVAVSSRGASFANGVVSMDVIIPDDKKIVFINVTADASMAQSETN